jgi:hypothetical protein
LKIIKKIFEKSRREERIPEYQTKSSNVWRTFWNSAWLTKGEGREYNSTNNLMQRKCRD